MRPRDIKPFVRTFRQVRRYLKTPFTPATAFEFSGGWKIARKTF